MDEFDYWRLCDDLSILQAALLIVGEDPSQNSSVESREVQNRPRGYEAAKTAIENALKRGDLEKKFLTSFNRSGGNDGHVRRVCAV